jgi:hypothetical protein
VPISSLDEEEASIVTPPSLSRRTSVASVSAAPYNNGDGLQNEENVSERNSAQDLHYLALPFGFGIGYSYSHLSNGSVTQARLQSLAFQGRRRRLEKRDSSELALSTGALPIPSISSASASEGLRSRARSIKEMCTEAVRSVVVREISSISEEEIDGMAGASTPRWSPLLTSMDVPASEGASGLPTDLDELAPSNGAPKGKGRFFGQEPAPSSHTLVDLGSVDVPDEASSGPNGIASSAWTAAPSSSRARHPHVEQLRREGRSETCKRVGKGTPTNTKVF